MAKIRDARVMITGASSGIGKAVAFECAAKGAKLTLASRNYNRLRQAAEEIRSAFPEIEAPLVIPCDVTDKKDVKRLIEGSADRFGGIDILLNNAGLGVYGDVEKTTIEDFRSVMEANFFGAVHCIFEALPFMKEAGKGLIVNIASLAAKHGVPYLGAYSASKAALAALSQSLRAELSNKAISIMIVYPGYTQTDFFRKEKNVGGARRPPGPYASSRGVARAVIRAIEREKRELVLSKEGKALSLFEGLWPWFVEVAMKRIANKLRDKKGGTQ